MSLNLTLPAGTILDGQISLDVGTVVAPAQGPAQGTVRVPYAGQFTALNHAGVTTQVASVCKDAAFGDDTIVLGSAAPASTVVVQATAAKGLYTKLDSTVMGGAYQTQAGIKLSTFKQGIEVKTALISASYYQVDPAGQADFALCFALTNNPCGLVLPPCTPGRVLYIADSAKTFSTFNLSINPSGSNTIMGSPNTFVISHSGWSGFLIGDLNGNWTVTSSPDTVRESIQTVGSASNVLTSPTTVNWTGDSVYVFDAMSVGVTLVMPSAAKNPGKIIRVKDTAAGASFIILQPFGTETVEGAAGNFLFSSIPLLPKRSPGLSFQSDGANWWLLS
jgi:hypothetical protein